jgi:hypothetical protein
MFMLGLGWEQPQAVQRQAFSSVAYLEQKTDYLRCIAFAKE